MERQQAADTKLQTICTHLSELALQKGPHARLPTVRELCALFTTSRVTLDEALDVLEQQNVLYRKQGSGIFVSPKLYRKSICILLDSKMLASAGASPFWGTLWGLLAQEARRRVSVKNEYHSFHMVVDMADQEQTLPEDVVLMIQHGRVHGILAIGLNEEVAHWLGHQRVPYIAFGMYSPYMVALDDTMLIRLAIEHLVRQGCQKIGLWVLSHYNGVSETSSLEERIPHVVRVFADHGVQYRPGLMRDYLSPPLCPTRAAPLPFQEQGYVLAMDVFGDTDSVRPDGLVIMNDMMTDGVVAAFHRLGVRLGEDVKVVTHGNTGSMMSFNHLKGLTVIDFDPQEIAQAMFAMLDTVLSGSASNTLVTHIQPHFRHTDYQERYTVL